MGSRSALWWRWGLERLGEGWWLKVSPLRSLSFRPGRGAPGATVSGSGAFSKRISSFLQASPHPGTQGEDLQGGPGICITDELPGVTSGTTLEGSAFIPRPGSQPQKVAGVGQRRPG